MSVERFLDAVAAEVRCREVHGEIRAELQEHILSLQEAYIKSGVEPEAALERAIEQMGAPAEIGQRLDKVHQPRIEWGLLGLTLLLTLIGLWSFWTAEGSLLPRLRLLGLGLAVGAPLILVDYRRLQRLGWPLFGLTWLVAAGLDLSYWAIPSWAWPSLPSLFLVATPVLFGLGLTAILADWDWGRPWAVVKTVALLVAPILLYARIDLAGATVYVVLWLVQMVASRPPKRVWTGFSIGTALTFALMAQQLMQHPYRVERLLNWIDPTRDPMGSGYHLGRSLAMLREAGLWGHGPLARVADLPESTGPFVFPYLVHDFGWAGGLALLLLIAGFGLRLYRAAQQIREPFGASLVRLVGALLVLQGGWNLLMAVGLLPITGLPLPFIAQDGALVYQVALMGLVLGVYRRKDLQASSGRTSARPGAPA